MKIFRYVIALLIITMGAGNTSHAQDAYIRFINKTAQGDTLRLTTWATPLSYEARKFSNSRTYDVVPDEEGVYQFQIALNGKPQFFSLSVVKANVNEGSPVDLYGWYLIEPADSLTIEVDKLTPIYNRVYLEDVVSGYYQHNRVLSGNYKFSFEVQEHLIKWKEDLRKEESIRFKMFGPKYSPKTSGADDLGAVVTELKESIRLNTIKYASRIRAIAYNKGNLNNHTRHVLAWNIYGDWLSAICSELYQSKLWLLMKQFPLSGADSLKFMKEVHAVFDNRGELDMKDFDTSYQIKSPQFVKAQFDKEFSGTDIYGFIQNYPDGLMKEKILMNFVVSRMNTARKGREEILDKIGKVLKDDVLKRDLEKYLAHNVVGSNAYPFRLPDANGKYHELNDFSGKVIVMDIWYTGCVYCVSYYKNTLKPLEEYFMGKDVVFISISIDKQKSTWKTSMASGMYCSPDGPNVINLFTEGKGVEHEFIKSHYINGFPYVLLIGKDGKIGAFQELRAGTEGVKRIIEKSLASSQKKTS